MAKNIVLAISFLFIFLRNSHSMDINSELIISGLGTEKIMPMSEIYGTIFVKLLNQKNITSDFHYQFGDNRQKINVAYVKFTKSKLDIIVGRQLMAWGSGYNFNPTDIFNSKPLGAEFDPSYYKTGRDAVTLSSYWGGFITDIVYATGFENTYTYKTSTTTVNQTAEHDYGIRIKANLLDFDIALSYIFLGERNFNDIIQIKDEIFGASIKGSIPVIDWGIWVESAYYNENKVNELITGLEYIYDKYSVNVEYYKNEFGESDKLNYNFDLQIQGKLLGSDYIIPSINYLVNEKLTLTAFAFNNLNDSSTIFGAVIDYFYNNNIEIAFLPFVLSGDEDSEYGIQQESFGSFGLQGLIKLTF